MKPLDKEFKKHGFFFKEVQRQGNIAIYSKQHPEETRESYEVFRIRSHNGMKIAGNEIPPAEFMPSSEQWGTFGWTYLTLEESRQKFENLLKTPEGAIQEGAEPPAKKTRGRPRKGV